MSSTPIVFKDIDSGPAYDDFLHILDENGIPILEDVTDMLPNGAHLLNVLPMHMPFDLNQLTYFDTLGNVNLEAFDRLIAILKQVSDENFDLEYWVNPTAENLLCDQLFNKPSDVFEECGTTACAIGHAALDMWFIKNGFGFHRNNRKLIDPNPSAKIITIGYEVVNESGVSTLYGGEAICEFFGINMNQTRYLFHPTELYSTRIDVIEQIGLFVKTVRALLATFAIRDSIYMIQSEGHNLKYSGLLPPDPNDGVSTSELDESDFIFRIYQQNIPKGLYVAEYQMAELVNVITLMNFQHQLAILQSKSPDTNNVLNALLEINNDPDLHIGSSDVVLVVEDFAYQHEDGHVLLGIDAIAAFLNIHSWQAYHIIHTDTEDTLSSYIEMFMMLNTR